MSDEPNRDRVYTTPDDADTIFHRLVDYVSEWKKTIPGLRPWSFNFHVSHDEVEGACLESYDDAKTGIRIDAWPKYEDATFNVFLPNGVEWSEAEIEEIAVHELMHALTSPLMEALNIASGKHSKKVQALISLHEEQVCTRLANGFIRTKYKES